MHHAEYNGLIALSKFEPIFEVMRGRKVLHFRNPHGNVGDAFIEAATDQLMQIFGIERVEKIEDCDFLTICGGGFYGIWDGARKEREKLVKTASAFKKTIIQLPCSIHPPLGDERIIADMIYLREQVSYDYYETNYTQELMPFMDRPWELAPDLALGYTPSCSIHGDPFVSHGRYMRDDKESNYSGVKSDPRKGFKCSDPVNKYIQFARDHKVIETDLLHFAIAGLHAGSKVILRAGNWHKNKAMWETWLQKLGCEFKD